MHGIGQEHVGGADFGIRTERRAGVRVTSSTRIMAGDSTVVQGYLH